MANYCDKCKRMIGVGCACGMTYAEKIKTIPVNLGSFRAVKS